MTQERIAVVGSRAHPDLSIVRDYVDTLPRGVVVVSGGAEGVDRCAAETAGLRGLHVEVFRPAGIMPSAKVRVGPDDVPPGVTVPPWGGFRDAMLPVATTPREQLLLRNTFIALRCTRMVVFPDGSRGGAWDAARQADRLHRPVEVRRVDGRVEPYPRRAHVTARLF